MFALCGKAQVRATELALSAARGVPHPIVIDHDVQQEALREHVWRCLLDLPSLLGESALKQEFILGTKMIALGQRDELQNLLKRPCIHSLRTRLCQCGEVDTSASTCLPMFDAKGSLTVWPRLSAEFCSRPQWQGVAAETGALARSRARSSRSTWCAHWQARFDELEAWAAGRDAEGCVGTVSAVPVAPGIGRALVETARGLLMHEVVLDGDVVSDYRIVAPTEWNFHPQGGIVNRLLGADARDREALRQQVARLVTTLDPCVPWELEWA
jgi:hypothetical protein